MSHVCLFFCLAHLTGPRVPLLRKRHMANTLVVRVHLEVSAVRDVVEILDILLVVIIANIHIYI